ncbi:MAG: magnesium transporter, partial [Leptospira sp.]|nr:magnesium transporter [Leptospira sp.]
GIANGLILGLVTGGLVYLFKQTVMLSFVIGLAMFLNLIVAGFVGSSIPLLLKYFRIDPAIASSIFVTACTDAFGFFCFLGLATLFINFL